MFANAQGYEDNNDAVNLARDPAFKIMAGKAQDSAGDLASQPTLSRFENRVTVKDLRRLSIWFLDLYLKIHPGPRKVIVLDMDATDDPTHGKQQPSFFLGYYEEHMYHPFLVFDGRTGFPLAAVLRPGNTHASHGALAVLKRLIKKLKQAYPGASHPLPGRCRLCCSRSLSLPGTAGGPLRYQLHQPTTGVMEKASPLLQKAQAAYQATGER
jgi:hypothetical protein